MVSAENFVHPAENLLDQHWVGKAGGEGDFLRVGLMLTGRGGGDMGHDSLHVAVADGAHLLAIDFVEYISDVAFPGTDVT